MSSSNSPARIPSGIFEEVNAILTSTDEIPEGRVDRIIKQFEEYESSAHASLLRCLTLILRVRFLLPNLFLKPPLVGFSENDSELIGEGSFGTVYITEYQGENVAVKVISHNTGGADTSLDDVKAFFREVQWWKIIGEVPHITPFYGCFARVNENPRLIITLVSPLADHSLRDYVDDNPREKCRLILDVAKGIRNLHELGFIHGDLSRDNVLIFNGDAKLADFGLTKLAKTASPFSLTGKIKDLPIERVGPDVARDGNPRSDKSDIFAFGTLVYELFTNRRPVFVTRPPIVPPPRPPQMQDRLWDGLWELLLECWRDERDTRPDARDIVFRLTHILDNTDNREVGGVL